MARGVLGSCVALAALCAGASAGSEVLFGSYDPATGASLSLAALGKDRSVHVVDEFRVCTYYGFRCGVASAAVGELNGDGLTDLVTQDQILLDDGAGFVPAAILEHLGEALALVDLDFDGNLDLVTSGEDYATHSILNLGGGRFQYVEPLGGENDTGGRPLAAGDIDGDGIPDVVKQSSVFFGIGDGRFLPSMPLIPGPGLDGSYFSVGDLWIADVDGAPPAEVLVLGEYYRSPEREPGLYLVRLDGTGRFTPPELIEPAASAYFGVLLLDADGDGFLDKLEESDPPEGSRTRLSWGRPGPVFEPGPAFAALGPPLVGDFDEDGVLDLLLGSSIFWGTGLRGYAATPAVILAPGDPVRPIGRPIGIGAFAARFVRGDGDQSGAVDLADPFAVLRWLFLGGASPVCPDAADADDSGGIEVSDVIMTLRFLFLGGASPADPFPEKGLDLSRDGLDCAAAHRPLPEAPQHLPPPPPGAD